MNLFNPISISSVHQRALKVEKQVGRRFGSEMLTNTSSNIGGVNLATNSGGLGQCAPINVAVEQGNWQWSNVLSVQ